MINFKTIISFLSLLILSACASKNTVKQNDPPLLENEGYVALVFDSKDKLRSLKIYGESSQATDLHISSIPVGTTLYLYKVPQGKYCISKFSTHYLNVTITEGGACLEVEAGKINYPGHIMPRRGTIYFQAYLNEFMDIMNTQYPSVCNEFLLGLCQKQFSSEDMDKIRFNMPGISSLREEHRRKKAPKAGTRIRGKNDAVDTRDVQ